MGELQGWAWMTLIHPEDLEGIANKWRASVASGTRSYVKHDCGVPMGNIAGFLS
jgi:hypothetical protein